MVPGPFGLDPQVWAILRLVLAIALAAGLVFNGALAQIYLERKIQAIIQDRVGPIHTGPWGLLQTFADAIKLLGKEDIRAKLTDRWFFLAAPAIVFSPMLASFVVIPFDLPEAESELVAGFLTEYSGMRWGLFFVAEYGEVTVVSGIVTTLWLGGWHGPWTDIHPLIGPVLGVLWFTLKTYFLVLVFMWIRATLPRFRIDQLMSLCWKLLIPVTLTNLMVTAVLLLAFPQSEIPVAVANWLMLLGLVALVPFLQRRRLVTLRARLAAERAPALRASQS